MIKRLKYNEIDFEKYRLCVEKSVQKNYYVQKETLDALCESWEFLVEDDYKVVMPIPVKIIWGRKFVLMPLFCQQLGVFSSQDSTAENDRFLGFLNRNYNVYQYAFNSTNKFSSLLLTKKNYCIPAQTYQSLRKKYFKGRKSTVKMAQKLHFRPIQWDAETQPFFKKNSKGLDKTKDVERLMNYISFLDNKGELKLYGSFLDETLVSAAALIFNEKEIALLSLLNDETHKSENGASHLIDSILQKYIAEKDFNFMGGNIRGIEVFFKSFGAENHEYPVVINGKLNLIKNIFRK